MIAPTASSAEVYDQSYKFLFGTLTPNETVSEPIAKLVTEKNPNIKRVAILARNDLFPLAVAQAFEKAMKAQNLEVVTFERYAIGTMDHAAAITQMRAARPDWVYASGYINDLILIRRQMNDLGLKPQILTMIAGPAYPEFAKTVGPLAENITSMSWWHPAVRYKGKDVFGSTEAFNAAWEKKYGGEADYVDASSAVDGAIIQLGIEAANSIDPAKVRDAIAALDVETFYGKIKFAASGQINSLQPPVFQLQGGQPVVLWPPAIKQGDLRFSIP
jgi:branched-chain amino acid transport system substrate-binding protein